MTTKPLKKQYNESASLTKPDLELRLSYFGENSSFELILNYLFDLEVITKKTACIIYKPGFYMEPSKPDLELELKKETDKMYIAVRGFDGTRYIIMNPEFIKRLNKPELSNNYYDKIVLKRALIETCFNNLEEKYRAILIYFLCPYTTMESKGISNSTASKIRKNVQSTRVKKMFKAVNFLINGIVCQQEGLI